MLSVWEEHKGDMRAIADALGDSEWVAAAEKASASSGGVSGREWANGMVSGAYT